MCSWLIWATNSVWTRNKYLNPRCIQTCVTSRVLNAKGIASTICHMLDAICRFIACKYAWQYKLHYHTLTERTSSSVDWIHGETFQRYRIFYCIVWSICKTLRVCVFYISRTEVFSCFSILGGQRNIIICWRFVQFPR